MQETISEVDTPKRRSRRSYTKEFKARIVAQCGQGDKSIAQVAMEHQINANLIHKWSQQYGACDYQPMVAVSLAAPEIVTPQNNRIDVMIGEVTVRFIGPVDPQNARVVLDALR